MVDIIKQYAPVKLTDAQLNQMRLVYDKLVKVNEVINLTSIKSETEAAELHFIDSLYPLTTGFIKGKVIDVGSGGGFPGLPVAIVSETQVTCLDAARKKLDFIAETAAFAGIGNLTTLCGRAEELSLNPAYREKFDVALSRGVAKLDILCEWCLPYVKQGGYFIAMKGPGFGAEVEKADRAMRILGGSLVSVMQYGLEISGHTHSLVIIKKIAGTPAGYPRRNALILKKPL